MMVATGGIPQIEQTYQILSILILHDLYSRKSCHMHSPLPVTLQMHSPQTVKLLAITIINWNCLHMQTVLSSNALWAAGNM